MSKKNQTDEAIVKTSEDNHFSGEKQKKKPEKMIRITPSKNVFHNTKLPCKDGRKLLGEGITVNSDDEYLMNHVRILEKLRIVTVKEVNNNG